jgi:hypothetical protein
MYMSKVCTVENCSNKVVSKGLCDKHRIRLKRHGNLHFTKKYYFETLEEAFFEIMGNLPESDKCIIWKGRLDRKGYGTLSVKSIKMKAHRFSYQKYIGEISEGLCVCHSCDNPSCVNPKHLWLGTSQENIMDKISKGRDIDPPKLLGELNYNSRFNEETIKLIRKEHKESKTSFTDLARRYGVTRCAISLIVKRKTWKHVE